MNIGAPALLVGYAYHQAGGGSAGVAAALAALEQASGDTATLVKSAGAGPTLDLLELGQTKALEAGTYSLLESAGLGPQVVQNLLNPPTGYSNPLLTARRGLDPGTVGAFAKYQYSQAEKAGQTALYTQQATKDAWGAVEAFPADLYDSAIPPSSQPKSAPKTLTHPMDANQDGLVSPTEKLGYALDHAYLDPKDSNLDGFVSPSEAFAYSLQHPAQSWLEALTTPQLGPEEGNTGYGPTARLNLSTPPLSAFLDVFA